MHVSVGETVLLPEYGGHTVKIGEDVRAAASSPARPRPAPRASALRRAAAPARARLPRRPCLAALPHPLLLPPVQELHLYREEDLLGKFSPLK